MLNDMMICAAPCTLESSSEWELNRRENGFHPEQNLLFLRAPDGWLWPRHPCVIYECRLCNSWLGHP